jgi:hypothetical protein
LFDFKVPSTESVEPKAVCKLQQRAEKMRPKALVMPSWAWLCLPAAGLLVLLSGTGYMATFPDRAANLWTEPSERDGGYSARIERLANCYEGRQCEQLEFDTPGWLSKDEACLLNCLGLTADSTVAEQGVFAGIHSQSVALASCG